MAVVTRKTASITNRDATPVVLTDAAIVGGVVREAIGIIEATSGDSTGSVYIMCQVPSNARISQVLLSHDDVGTTGAADVGIYQTTANSNTVVDADFFASAVSMNGGAATNTDVTHESAVFGIEDQEKPLWEALGLTSDPVRDYDVALTLTGDADAGATISLKVRYCI